MRLKLSILILLSLSLNVYSQYTPLINSNRPGKSESPFSVGTKILQIESGIDLGQLNNHKENYYQSSYNFNTNIRYGILSEKLELKVYGQYQKEQINNFQTALSYGGGIKYLLYMPKKKDLSNDVFSWKERSKYDWKRLIPSVGLNVNYHGNWMGLEQHAISSNLLLQNQLSESWTFVTNIGMDGILTDQLTFENILTSISNINPYWSFYMELQNRTNQKFRSSDFSLGMVYLKTKNLQFDFSTKAVFYNDMISYFVMSGISWRLDRHKDKFKDKNEELFNKMMGVEEKPKNLVQRSLGKVGSLFGKLFKKKKKDETAIDINSDVENNEIETQEKPKKKGLFKKLFSKKKPDVNETEPEEESFSNDQDKTKE